MSRNFELLQQIEGGSEILSYPSCEGRPAGTPAWVDRLPAECEPLISLVQRVFLVPGVEAPRLVVFSGADRGSGCTWVCAHTCRVLAALVSGSVCIVDANLRSPGLHQYLDLQGSPGLTEALSQPAPIRDFVQAVPDGRFSVLGAGAAISDRDSTLDLNRVRSRIKELRQEFDYVLVDAPSLDLYTDGIVLAGASDGMIMVLGANSSRREPARNAVAELKAARVRLLGAVLNKRVFHIPEAIYRRL
jgi:polysaccharide biosynthesis transport protein